MHGDAHLRAQARGNNQHAAADAAGAGVFTVLCCTRRQCQHAPWPHCQQKFKIVAAVSLSGSSSRCHGKSARLEALWGLGTCGYNASRLAPQTCICDAQTGTGGAACMCKAAETDGVTRKGGAFGACLS